MWHRVANAVFIRFSEQWVVLVTQRVVNLICRARNAFGSVTRNYSLEVSSLGLLASMDSSPASGASVVVTGISPRNSSLQIGQSGRLSCSVRSHETPHIKWLKQVPIWILAPKFKYLIFMEFQGQWLSWRSRNLWKCQYHQRWWKSLPNPCQCPKYQIKSQRICQHFDFRRCEFARQWNLYLSGSQEWFHIFNIQVSNSFCNIR